MGTSNGSLIHPLNLDPIGPAGSLAIFRRY
jgi:hypothetical protein